LNAAPSGRIHGFVAGSMGSAHHGAGHGGDMTARASRAARAIFVLGISASSLAVAQDRGRDTAHATIEVSGSTGGRTEADVTPALTRMRTALARCAEQGRSASGGEVQIALDVAANGRATVAPVGDSAAVAFQTCIVGALARVRLAAGEPGTVRLRIGWHEPRAYGTATFGGFHGRSSSLPEHPRAEREALPYPDAQIAAVAHEHDAEVHHCFASELTHRPDVAGTIRLRFTIGLDGTVSDASVEHDDVHVAAINACLVARLSSWTFPAPTTGAPATVTHAFALR
jgi:hypothetical protein